jgi:hypothetical protein
VALIVVHLITRKVSSVRVAIACGLTTYSEISEAHLVTRARPEVTCLSCRSTRMFRRTK